MNRSDALELLIEALNVPAPFPTEETDPTSLEAWDSMGQMSVIAAVDSTFQVVLSPQKLIACKSFGEMIDLFADKLD